MIHSAPIRGFGLIIKSGTVACLLLADQTEAVFDRDDRSRSERRMRITEEGSRITELQNGVSVIDLAKYGMTGAKRRDRCIHLLLKKPSKINVYTGLYILALALMSLLDCHFFNVGPVLFYSTALAVMEHGR